MNINWKLRLQNKATLAALIATIVAFVYQALGIFGVVPAISQDEIITGAGIVLNLLVAIGVVVDPTTEGFKDTEQAMGYEKPRSDE